MFSLGDNRWGCAPDLSFLYGEQMIHGTVCHLTVGSSIPVILFLCWFYEKRSFCFIDSFFISNYFPLCFIFFFCLLSVMTLPFKPGLLKLGFQLCPKVPILNEDTRNVLFLGRTVSNLTGRERRGCSIILCRSISSI